MGKSLRPGSSTDGATPDADAGRAPGRTTRTQALPRRRDAEAPADREPAEPGRAADPGPIEDPFALHLIGSTPAPATEETPGELHERLGREAQAILSRPPASDMSPAQALEERTRLARQLEAHFTAELEPGIGMFITIEAGPDPQRSDGLEVTIVIAPNDWKTVFKIAVGVIAVGGALLWAWRSGGGGGGDADQAEQRPPAEERGAADLGHQADVQPDVNAVAPPTIRGLPNLNNDCFLNSIIQLLAGAYPALLTANESMRVDMRAFVRAHDAAANDGNVEARVDALRDALSAEAPDLGALAGIHGPDAADANVARGQLAAILEGRAAHLRMRNRLVSLIQRVNQADGAAIGAGEVQQLRAMLVQHGILPGVGEQEDAQQVLTQLLDLFTPAAGNRIGVSERLTILASAPEVVPEADEVAEYQGGSFEHAMAPEPLLMVPLDAHDDLIAYLDQAYGGAVDQDVDARARDDGHGVRISRQRAANRFTRLPPVMTIMLQRSLPDGGKVVKAFGMPEQLTLLEGDPPTRRKRYRLASFVFHRGERAAGGHYWAHRRDQGRWQSADDRRVGVDRQQPDVGGPVPGRDPALPHDINHGYIYSYVLEDDQAHADGGPVAAGVDLDVGQLPPAAVGGLDGVGGRGGPSSVRRGHASAPRPTSPPDLGVGAPLDAPVRSRGVDEEPVTVAEVLAAAAAIPELGAVAVPPARLALRDPRLPAGVLYVEVQIVDGDGGEPMWVGPGEEAPSLMVASRADLKGARDWFAMALDRIRQAGLAGMRYKPPPVPTREEPEPLDGARVVKDQLVDRDAVPRHVTTVHTTLAGWLPGRIAEKDDDDRLLNVTVAYAAQLGMTHEAAASLVLELSELWLAFNPSVVGGEEELIRPLVVHLWQQLTPLADARARQHAERVRTARDIPAGERKVKERKPPPPTTTVVTAPDTSTQAPPQPKGSDDDEDGFLFGEMDFGEDEPAVIDPRKKLEPDYLMDDGYRELHALLADDAAPAHAVALLEQLRKTPKQLKQAAYMVSELLRRGATAGDAGTIDPSTVDPSTVDPSALDTGALDAARTQLAPLGVDVPHVDAPTTGPTPTGGKAPADPDAIIAVLNKLNPEVIRIFADFLDNEQVEIDLDQLKGRERKARVLKTLPTPAEIDAATESFFLSPVDAEMLQSLLGFHTAARLISYYRANNAIVSIRALVGQLRKLAPVLIAAEWPPLTSGSIVLDTNVVKALLLAPGDLSAEERAVRRKALSLFTHLAPTDLRLPNMVVGELSAFGPGVFELVESATGIPCHGVPLDGPRDNPKREGTYAADLLKMEEAQVGGDKGAPDRGLVNDTIHAERSGDLAHHPDQPTRMMTADLGIARHLRQKYLGAEHGSHADDADPFHFTTAGLSQPIDVYAIDIPEEFARHGRPVLPSADLGGFVPPVDQVDLDPLVAPAGLAHGVFSRPVGPDALGLQVHHLVALIRSSGGEVVVTGGAVRDAVRGEDPVDVDLTCTLKLAQLEALVDSHDRFRGLGRELIRLRGLRLLKLSTGTNAIDITCADEDEDKALDAEGLAHDAGKRDFRMNALYLDGDGELHDPTGEGVADALQKRLVIVADKFFGDLTTSTDPPFEEIGRSFKFVGRDYEMPAEQQALLRDAYLALIERARAQDATEVAETVRMMEKAREKTPVEIMQTMIKLGLSDRAIRALFPDSVAGLAADRTPAFERSVVPRHLDNPRTPDGVVPGAEPQVKIDEEHGRVYQYRVFARTEDPEERLMIDIDFTDHDLPGHRAQHHHIYRWNAATRVWDKHIAGISKTGQPGRPDLDGDLYRGPRPWLVEEQLDQDAGDAALLVEQLNQGLAGFSYQAAQAGELIDLGGELLLHPAKLQEMRRNGTLRLVFMLIENVVTRGKLPPLNDESLDELTKTGGERLRFRRHLEDVDLMLQALGVAGDDLLTDIPVGGKIRLYDLIVAWRRDAGALEAAMKGALARKPASVEMLVELCEANLALAEQKVDQPGDVLDQTLVAAQDHHAGPVGGDSREAQQAAIRTAAEGGTLRFGSPSAAGYHWLKHGEELGPPGSTRETFGLDAYVAAANAAVVGASAKDSSVEVEQTGATSFVFLCKDPDGDIKVVVKLVGGLAQLATCFRRTARAREAEMPRLPPVEALERLDRVTTLVMPEPSTPAQQVGRLVGVLEEEVASAAGAEHAERRAAIVHLVAWARGRVDACGDVPGEQLEGWRTRLDEVARLAAL